MPERILIIDDEPSITRAFSSLLSGEGYTTACAASADIAEKTLRTARFDLILLDLNLPGTPGIEFLRRLHRDSMLPAVLVISGQSDISVALEAVKLGALDYLEKPVPPEKLLTAVRSALLLSATERQRSLMLNDLDRTSPIIGESTAIKRLLHTIDQAAATDVTVLFTGENGTGKELAATRLYLGSNRRHQPFVKVNCPGIPATLFESELFGHMKGAFTGATKDFPGKFALADHGTLFLDEIGDLPLECQAKLLRVLESGELERLGSVDRTTVDVRIVAASNRSLPELSAQGKFREDLYYRLSVFTIELPPLRERRDDIPLLVGDFLRRFDPSGRTKISPAALADLVSLDYPGNVRQLKNTIERLSILCAGRTVEPADLTPQPHAAATDPAHSLDPHSPSSHSPSSQSLADRLAACEREIIRTALAQSDNNISAAARLLNTDRANLSRRIKDLGLR